MRCVKSATAPVRPHFSTSEDLVVGCDDTTILTDTRVQIFPLFLCVYNVHFKALCYIIIVVGQ